MRKFLIVTILISSTLQCAAQSLNTAQGYIPNHPYATTTFDSVDLASGSVSLNIPLRSFKQQDPLSIDYSILYNSKHLSVGFTDASDASGLWVWTDKPITAYGVPVNLTETPQFSGARVSMSQDYRVAAAYIPYATGSANVAILPDNSIHITFGGYGIDDSGYSSGEALGPYFYLAGTAVSAEVGDREGIDHVAWLGQPTTGTAPIPLYQNGFFSSPMLNVGNQPLTITDVKGLTLPWTDPNSGSVGTTVDSSHCPSSQNFFSAFRLDMPGPGGNSVPYYLCYATVHVKTNFASSPFVTADGASHYAQNLEDDIQMLAAVVLPDATTWQFEYQDRDLGDDPSINYGTLSKVTMPSGGTIRYGYTTVTPCPVGYVLDDTSRSRFIQKRTETPQGDGPPPSNPRQFSQPATWTYSFVPGTASNPISIGETEPYIQYTDASMTVTNPDLSTEVHTIHVDATTCGGYEEKVQTYAPNGTPLLTEENGYVQTAYGWAELNGYPGQFASSEIATKKTTLDDGSWFYEAWNYDSSWQAVPGTAVTALMGYGNVVERCTFDFGVPLAESSPNFNPCSQGATSPTLQHSTSTYAYQTDPRIMNKTTVGVQTSYDSLGNIVAQVQNIFDGDGVNSPFGSLGAVKTWVGGQNWLTQIVGHDGNGLTTSTTDPMGHTTTYGHDAASVYVETVTSPIAADGYTHVSHAVHDANTDLVAASYDENGANTLTQSTTYTYDSMLRVHSVTLPKVSSGAGGASISYINTPGSLTVTASMTQQIGAPPVTASKSYDGFGRPWQSVATDSIGSIYSDTTYDIMGRVVAVTNPYRSATDATAGVTCTSYDFLGRVTGVKHVSGLSCTGGAVLSSTMRSPFGPWVDIVDGDQHHSRQRSNSISQLMQVQEPDSTGAPTLETDYLYDPLGNLQHVHQVGLSASESPRNRQFTYDPLSRLLAAYNPETGIGTGSCTGATQAWSLCYSYDVIGNLKTKVDARGYTTTYGYDALSRPISKTYTSPGGGTDTNTPTTCYAYDTVGTTGALGKLAAEWTQQGAACPSALPSGTLTSHQILAYDALGEVINEKQCVLTQCVTSGTMSYDLAGNLTQYFNQAALIRNSYDSANRLSQVTAQLPGATNPSILYSVGSFSPAGPQVMSIGSSLTKVRTYDPMMRPIGEITYKNQ